jgi:hypothetical protein
MQTDDEHDGVVGMNERPHNGPTLTRPTVVRMGIWVGTKQLCTDTAGWGNKYMQSKYNWAA